MPTPMQTHQQTIHDLTSTEGLVSLTPPTQNSAVLCTQPPAGEHHTKKADDARQPKKGFKHNTHTSATRHPHLPTPPQKILTFCAPHAHPLLPTAMAFVSYGFSSVHDCQLYKLGMWMDIDELMHNLNRVLSRKG
jgi:hypothetical protein